MVEVESVEEAVEVSVSLLPSPLVVRVGIPVSGSPVSVETSVDEASEVVVSVEESVVDVEVVSSVLVEVTVELSESVVELSDVVEESAEEELSVVCVVLSEVDIDVSVSVSVRELPSPSSPPEIGEVGSDGGLVSVDEPVGQVSAKDVETEVTVCVTKTV